MEEVTTKIGHFVANSKAFVGLTALPSPITYVNTVKNVNEEVNKI